jgi:hypothetical protein
MVDYSRRRGLCPCGVLLLDDLAGTANPSGPAARSAHLPEPLLGPAGLALLPHGRLRQPGRSAPRNELALLDRSLLRDARRNRRGPLLPAPPARGLPLPLLLDSRAKRLPFLSPVQLPTHSQLRPLLPHRARLRSVLHLLWPRTTCRRGCACWASSGRVARIRAACLQSSCNLVHPA